MHDQGPGCFTRGREQPTAYSAHDGARRRGQSPQLASLDDLFALGSTNGKPRAGALPVLMLDPKLTPRARCVAVHDGRTGRTVVCASTVNVGLVKGCLRVCRCRSGSVLAPRGCSRVHLPASRAHATNRRLSQYGIRAPVSPDRHEAPTCTPQTLFLPSTWQLPTLIIGGAL